MTYCLAIRVEEGIVFAADTRTNAGVDYVTTYRKLHVFEPTPDRSFVLLAAGSLATTHELVDQIRRDLDNAPNGESLATVMYPFEAADYVGRLSRQIQDKHAAALAQSGVSGEVTLILGGQISGHPPEVMLIYPQGNYIAATDETPYLQIGETKYGKPVLDRLATRSMSLAEASRLALVSLDATVRSNITVGLPFDFATYRADTFLVDPRVRIEETTPYYVDLRASWQRGFEEMFARLEPFPLGAASSTSDASVAPPAPDPVNEPLPS